MSNLSTRLGNIGLIPVVVFDKVEYALPTAKAMIAGGLPVMEVTLRTDAAIEAMKLIKQNYPEIILGAGTVLNEAQARAAVEAGCEFIVSPGFDDGVVKYCLDNNILVMPGCVTPTEINHALSFGIKILKFFPANIYGGINGCKALHGPYRMVKFVPTGGVSLDNLSEYADKDYIHAIGGGWLCSTKDMANRKFENISETIKKSIDVLLGFELVDIANTDGIEIPAHMAKELENAFHLNVKQGSYAKGMKSQLKRANAQIAVKCNNIDRAVYYLEQRGYKADKASMVEKEDRKTAIYLEEEIGGFAVQLLQK